jgi:hypothetical protein
MVLYGCLAVRSGRSVEVSPAGVITTPLPPEWLHPTYRNGWTL